MHRMTMDLPNLTYCTHNCWVYGIMMLFGFKKGTNWKLKPKKYSQTYRGVWTSHWIWVFVWIFENIFRLELSSTTRALRSFYLWALELGSTGKSRRALGSGLAWVETSGLITTLAYTRHCGRRIFWRRRSIVHYRRTDRRKT